ncbi:hypothetical protein EX30DRAFT_325767 [Ascodesmis nigricans]|uniref:Uncharacterized protein n=1 Tax=Ascodesmis nigricans TaxID=341454 RepID=A0A4S2N6E8_9PEZI|nr:hypothetical protein EX30DRAFT_325767 [Ascodesmis nigricans]
MTTQHSIYDIKSEFLFSQSRALSQFPDPPKDWLKDVEETEHGDLSDNVLNQALYKLSVIGKKHANLVYNAQTSRHIAEQLDALYRDTIEGFEGAPARDEEVLRRGVDLKDPDNIRDLPEEYPDYTDKASSEDLQRYQELRAQLSRYPDLLDALKKKHAYYKHLEKLVVPFDDPKGNVQPNLVTSSGELGKELERMRLLAARLAAQVERVKQDEVKQSEEDEDLGMADEEKLRRLIGDLA